MCPFSLFCNQTLLFQNIMSYFTRVDFECERVHLTHNTMTFIRWSTLVRLKMVFPLFCISLVSGPAGIHLASRLRVHHRSGRSTISNVYLRRRPGRSTTRCSSAYILSAGSCRCPDRTFVRSQSGSLGTCPGSCWGAHTGLHLPEKVASSISTTGAKIRCSQLGPLTVESSQDIGDVSHLSGYSQGLFHLQVGFPATQRIKLIFPSAP